MLVEEASYLPLKHVSVLHLKWHNDTVTASGFQEAIIDFDEILSKQQIDR